MRNYILLAAALTIMVSCNDAPPEVAQQPAAVTTENAAVATPAIAAKLDPICEMVYDTSWTEYTVYNNDTIHFCSEQCKSAFLARPEKYTKAVAQ